MKAWGVLFLVLGALVSLPTVVAHSCGGTGADCVCPPPNDGQMHAHGGSSGGCSSAGGASASGGSGGGSASVPGAPIALVLVALLGVAVLSRRS